MYELGLIGALASAVMAGVFFAFSSFVMKALGNIDRAEGIRAMQRINIDVFSLSFMLMFFGLPLVALLIGVHAVLNWQANESIYYLMASVIYLAGSFGVTVAGNVPLNNRLATVNPESGDANSIWEHYLISWTLWNHLRTFACVLTSVALVCASVVK